MPSFREFQKTRRIEKWYQSKLWKISALIAEIIRRQKADSIRELDDRVQASMEEFSDRLADWAMRVSASFVQKINRADYDAWLKQSERIGRSTRRKLREAGVGETFHRLQNEQVILIQSLPLDAAKKVHEWTEAGIERGERMEDIVDRIMGESEELSREHATLIARTETARTRSNFTQARAMSLGSTEYIWRSVHDKRTRDLHRELDGNVFKWTLPPVAGFGRGGIPVHAHAGGIWNCFTGETLVRLDRDIRRVIRSPFNGRVVDIHTSGASVTATPNHPMLTQRGWVAAGEIREGDYLLESLGDAVHVIEADEERGHVRIADLFDAFSVEHITAPGVHFDFYGDRPDGEVDTAPVKWELIFDRMPQLRKSVPDLGLSQPSGVVDGVRLDTLDVGGSGGGRKTATLGESHPLHPDDVRFAGCADMDIAFFKAIPNDSPGDLVGCGESKNGFPGLVSAEDLCGVKFEPVPGLALSGVGSSVDPQRPEVLSENIGGVVDSLGGVLEKNAGLYKGFRVSELLLRDFLGHVYTLETGKGWYSVTTCNYTVKNCRCYAEPILPKELLEE